jgi:transmembrane sensor
MKKDHTELLTEEALQWFVLLRDEGATDADRRRFSEWLARSPSHRAAWQRAQYVWSRSSAMEAHVSGATVASRPPPRLNRREWMSAAAAVGIAAVIGGLVVMKPGLAAQYRTGAGERRVVDLPDGSTAELGTSTALSVDYGERACTVTVHHGEAFFTVASRPERIFSVGARGGRTLAVAGQFDLKCTADMVVLSVIEGVASVSVSGRDSLAVQGGQQLRYGTFGVAGPQPVDLGIVQAWRRNRLVFNDAPLGEVIAELNRYRRGAVLITDDSIAALPVTAVFDARQTDAALRTIADTLPVRMRGIADFLIFISPDR